MKGLESRPFGFERDRHRSSNIDDYDTDAHLSPETFRKLKEAYNVPDLTNRFIQKELYVARP